MQGRAAPRGEDAPAGAPPPIWGIWGLHALICWSLQAEKAGQRAGEGEK
jgi:hypothetical protein